MWADIIVWKMGTVILFYLGLVTLPPQCIHGVRSSIGLTSIKFPPSIDLVTTELQMVISRSLLLSVLCAVYICFWLDYGRVIHSVDHGWHLWFIHRWHFPSLSYALSVLLLCLNLPFSYFDMIIHVSYFFFHLHVQRFVCIPVLSLFALAK